MTNNIVELVTYFIIFAVLIIALYGTVRKMKKGGGCCTEKQGQLKRIPVGDKNKSHYPYHTSIKIGGIVCSNCAIRAENSLNSIEGVWARVKLDTKTAEILMKTPVEDQIFSEVLAREGYTVLNISTKTKTDR